MASRVPDVLSTGSSSSTSAPISTQTSPSEPSSGEFSGIPIYIPLTFARLFNNNDSGADIIGEYPVSGNRPPNCWIEEFAVHIQIFSLERVGRDVDGEERYSNIHQIFKFPMGLLPSSTISAVGGEIKGKLFKRIPDSLPEDYTVQLNDGDGDGDEEGDDTSDDNGDNN